MRRLTEIAVFVALAIGVHVLFALRPSNVGTESGGQGGDAMVTLAASTPQIEQMVDRWDAPPEPVESPPEMAPAPGAQSEAAPTLPARRPDLAPARQAMVALPSASAPAPEAPEIDLSSPPPPEPEPEPEPAVEPEPETHVGTETGVRPAEASPETSPRPEVRPESLAPPEPPRQTERRAERPEPQPERREQAPSAASTGQVSAGAGGRAQAGDSGSAAVRTMGDAQRARLISVWGGQIRARIERQKRYPRGARGAGRVVLRLTVTRDGRIVGAGLARSSGNAAFDRAAMDAVSRAGRLPPAPEGLAQPSYSFSLPMDFR